MPIRVSLLTGGTSLVDALNISIGMQKHGLCQPISDTITDTTRRLNKWMISCGIQKEIVCFVGSRHADKQVKNVAL